MYQRFAFSKSQDRPMLNLVDIARWFFTDSLRRMQRKGEQYMENL